MPPSRLASPRPARERARRSRSPSGPACVALILGFLLGGSGGEQPETQNRASTTGALTAAASAGNLEFTTPDDFEALDAVPEVPGLSLSDAAALAPGGKDGGTAVVAGNVESASDNASLLPSGLRKALGDVPEPDPVAIGSDGLQAYRYVGLQPEGIDRSVTVYAAPTSAGVATLACLAPADATDAFASTCDQVANTLTLSSGEPIPLGPDKQYAAAVSKALGGLAKSDKSGRARLGSAKTPKAQASAARSLAAAYAKAAAPLAKVDVNPSDRAANAQLVGS